MNFLWPISQQRCITLR